MRTPLQSRSALALISAIILLACAAVAQSSKTLTNDDVMAMVKKKLPESVIVAAIKSTPGNYDTSANELIRLNSAGVTENELNAMLASGHKASDAQPAAAGSTDTNATVVSKSRMPAVTVL